ncbi:1,2-epoxyphenylacetyl-CoA isomerase [Candidatus Promineifilum breve]|uniref:1,2-epoxyphenylacetyl-CoA isomerase n=1 Tax=Candidatus Promineifilum breve TaxID=1806508 RepID=A0A161JZC5_9CHLR|nr:enoyl-CoA hydratase-related protein [Candidatus Promineifilum breve]CUS05467.2 1,2-epoxyphenylacetyl-CoA isomerase [Candidatus Promineifilum breve]
MTYETILHDVTDGVATITLNRPSKLNAFNDPMIAETTDALKAAGRDAAVRCVVITGAGRGFSSGQDLSDFQERGENVSIGEHLHHGYHRLIRQMVALEKPIIGAINGIAAGAGCGVALAADIRIAADNASFMLAFSRIGLIPDSGVNWLLPRLVGYARAYEMAITADRVPAAQALEWGLVNRVVPAAQLPEITAAWARRLADGPTLAYGLTKRAMSRGWDMSLNEALEYEAYLQEVAGRSADNREGIAAFLEKREARFSGR